MFWVISVYFNIRNALPKSGTFLLGHPVYSSGRLIGFTSQFLHYAWYTHYPAFSWQDFLKPQCSSGQSVTQHIFVLGTSQIHDESIFTSVIPLNSDTRECFASFISDHVIPYAQQYLATVCKTSAETSVSSYCTSHCLLTSHSSHTINYTIQINMK